jgi:hypothetical protein
MLVELCVSNYVMFDGLVNGAIDILKTHQRHIVTKSSYE